jgi:hypothetical protein
MYFGQTILYTYILELVTSSDSFPSCVCNYDPSVGKVLDENNSGSILGSGDQFELFPGHKLS